MENDDEEEEEDDEGILLRTAGESDDCTRYRICGLAMKLRVTKSCAREEKSQTQM